MKGQKMFSQNLQKLRASKNISQEQLADKIGVSRQSVSAWESGKSSPELEKLVAISNLFNVSLDELTGEISTKKIDFDKEDYNKTYRKIAIIRSLGIFILFLGITLATFSSGYDFKMRQSLLSDSMPDFSILSSIVLMLSLAIAVPLFILARNFDKTAIENLTESNTKINEVFSKKEIQNAESIESFSKMALVSIIFIAIASHQVIYNFTNLGGRSASTIFMLLLGIGLSISTYSNSIFAKISNFNEIESENKEKNRKIGLFAAITMMSITAIYLTYSFITSDWSSARIFYPVGGIAVGIFAVITNHKK